MENLGIYERVRQVPEAAKRAIQAGRLKGKTDINPMWRIKALTEQFGPCGIGWKYVITDKRLEQGANNEVAAFLDIDLFVKVDGAWSEAIPGTGGSAFVASERNGLYTSDECFKMALTDAISVACKALGFGADVYWDKDSTKYDRGAEPQQRPQKAAIPPKQTPGYRLPPQGDATVICEHCGGQVMDYFDGRATVKAARLAARAKELYGYVLCEKCVAEAKEANDAAG